MNETAAFDPTRGFWVVLLSLFIALVLGVVSLPDSVPDWLAYARPNWIALVVFYWIISLPQRYDILLAWCSGLLMDVLVGGLLGQYALALLVLAVIALNLYQRLRMYTIWQQSLVLLPIMVLVQSIIYGIDYIALDRGWHPLLMLSSIVSALAWPWVFLVLRYVRRAFKVT